MSEETPKIETVKSEDSPKITTTKRKKILKRLRLVSVWLPFLKLQEREKCVQK